MNYSGISILYVKRCVKKKAVVKIRGGDTNNMMGEKEFRIALRQLHDVGGGGGIGILTREIDRELNCDFDEIADAIKKMMPPENFNCGDFLHGLSMGIAMQRMFG